MRALVVRPDGCWEWLGCERGHGYRKMKGEYAHRVFYRAAKGPVPAGMDLDHLCRNRWCCNPDHLEPVTRSVNLRRGNQRYRDRTHCLNGHEFTKENTRIRSNGARRCMACQKNYYEAKKRKALFAREGYA